jgi:hypothetical protein
VKSGNIDIVTLLLNNGADIMVKDNRGMSPEDYATDAIAMLLNQHEKDLILEMEAAFWRRKSDEMETLVRNMLAELPEDERTYWTEEYFKHMNNVDRMGSVLS